MAPAGSSYRVQSGDTLYEIASEFAPESRTAANRMMIAMFRANPDAFGGNINVLRAGAILRIPGPEALDQVGAQEAAREIGRQTAAWRSDAGTQDEGRLRLVTPTEASPEPARVAAADADPATRIEQLEREIAESQRLLELKSAELAELQRRAAEQAAQPPAVEPAPEPPAAEVPPAEEVPVDEAPVVAEPEPEAEPAGPEEPPAEEPAPAPVVPERSFVDSLTDNWTYVLGAAVLLLGGGLAFGYARRRREEQFGSSLGSFDLPAEAPVPSETQRLRALRVEQMETATSGEEEAERVGANRMAEREPEFRGDAGEGLPDESISISAEEAMEADQPDPLAEADFHMAYGLYDQAADIVKLALDQDPDRRDYKVKLAEIFFVAGKQDGFLDAAHDLHATSGDGKAADWDRIVIMGRQIAPDDPLFQGAAPGSDVDLNLAGGESRVDLELLAPPEGEEGLDLDLGEALAGGDSGAETGRRRGMDFDLGFDDEGTTDRTAEMRRGGGELPTAEMPKLAEGGESSTAEMPQLGEQSETTEATRLQPRPDETMREKIDTSGFARGPESTDATAEMAMDDLGIDLGDLEAFAGGPADEDDVTQIASIEEEDDTSATSVLPELAEAGEGTDLDLTELAPELQAADETDETGETQRMVREGGTATEKPALPEMSELEPVTMSEVGTKLDLARAYVDMGDPDGARSILEEVLSEGTSSQKKEAQRLLDSLPG